MTDTDIPEVPRTELFIPCRSGSVRVPRKNVRKFGDHDSGLVGYKLRALESTLFDRIVIDTDDVEVMRIVEQVSRDWRGPSLQTRRRPRSLASSSTTTDDLIAYWITTLTGDIACWTHVTSPFIGSDRYNELLSRTIDAASLGRGVVSVTSHRGFLLDSDAKPMNFGTASREGPAWPFTQAIPPVYEVNSGFFGVARVLADQFRDRMTPASELVELTGLETLDVDTEGDFELASAIARALPPGNEVT